MVALIEYSLAFWRSGEDISVGATTNRIPAVRLCMYKVDDLKTGIALFMEFDCIAISTEKR